MFKKQRKKIFKCLYRRQCFDSNILMAKFENFKLFRTFLVPLSLPDSYRKKWDGGGGGQIMPNKRSCCYIQYFFSFVFLFRAKRGRRPSFARLRPSSFRRSGIGLETEKKWIKKKVPRRRRIRRFLHLPPPIFRVYFKQGVVFLKKSQDFF